jgi:hypothetical protein
VLLERGISKNGAYADIRDMIREDLANGFIADAAKLRKLEDKYPQKNKFHPLSREAFEERESAKEGIAKFMLRGGSMNQVLFAAYDHNVLLEDLLPEARETFEKVVAEGNYDKAGTIAKLFGFNKNEIEELVHKALLDHLRVNRKNGDIANIKTLDDFLE